MSRGGCSRSESSWNRSCRSFNETGAQDRNNDWAQAEDPPG
eukprot:gene27139-biopygen17689